MCRALRLEYDDAEERVVEIPAPDSSGSVDVMARRQPQRRRLRSGVRSHATRLGPELFAVQESADGLLIAVLSGFGVA